MDQILATNISVEAKAAENSGETQRSTTSGVVVLFREDTLGAYTLPAEEAA